MLRCHMCLLCAIRSACTVQITSATLFLAFHPGMRAEDVTTIFLFSIIVDRQVLNTSAEFIFLSWCHSQEMQYMHVNTEVRWIHQQILVFLSVRKDISMICKAERIKLTRLTINVTGFLRQMSTVKYLMKTILNFVIASEKNYNEYFVSTGLVDNLENMTSSSFRIWISAQFYSLPTSS